MKVNFSCGVILTLMSISGKDEGFFSEKYFEMLCVWKKILLEVVSVKYF